MVDSNSSNSSSLLSPSGVRKRPRNESKWKKRAAKRERNLGNEYTSLVTGKSVGKRKIGPPCNCSRRCYNAVGQHNIETIFTEFWASGCWDAQTAYLQKQTTVQTVKRRRTENLETQKSCTRSYHVTVNDIPVAVCKSAFANIHGISKARVDRAQNNMTASSVPIADRRGRNGSHGQVSNDKLMKVMKHIESFPTITNHYSRKTSPNVCYLDTDLLSKKQMYELYKLWLEENEPGEVPCSWHYYDDTLKAKYPNLKLYKPRQDTCKTCDTYAVKCKDPLLTADDKKTLEVQHAFHLCRAEQGYKLPKIMVQNADNTSMVVCMDLQQALPTPKVSTGIAFYKRKMWTYNFNIHDYKTGRAYMFVWDEVTAKRGAIEICSCINKFINTFVPLQVKKLHIFSDNCSGQNKNFTLLMFYLSLIHSVRFEEITHTYFRPGHTYMAADRDFALIEKNLRRVNYVFTPDEHIDIIKKTRRVGERSFPFEVVKMEQWDFKDYECMRRLVTQRKPTRFRFIDSCYFRVSHEDKTGYQCDSNYMTLTEGKGEHVRISKGMGASADAAFDLSVCDVPPKYIKPIPLAKPKLEDLKVLVRDLVPAYFCRQYWNDILGNTADCEDNNVGFDEEEHEDKLDDIDPLIDHDSREHSISTRGFYDYV